MRRRATIVWKPGEEPATCPVCGLDGVMPARLRLESWLAERPPITLLECPACSACFFPRLIPLQYDGVQEPALSVLCEGAVGLESAVEALARIDRAQVRDFLDIGCGVGWTLDFGGRFLGWRARGVDPGTPAGTGRAELGVEIAADFLRPGSAGCDRFDLAYACEVIEHVQDQRALVATVRGLLGPRGIFLLHTPDAAALTEEAPREVLDGILCPGWHVVLHTERSLRHLLQESGFRVVHALVEGATVHAAAADQEFAWRPAARFEEAALRGYLASRAAELSPGSALRSGLLGTLFGRLTRAGEHEPARQVYSLLRDAISARHGIDPEAPDDLFSAGERAAEAVPPTPFPAAVCGALHGRGSIALRVDGDRAAAERYFQAAARAARALASALDERVDLGVQAAVREAELYAMATARDQDAAREWLDRVELASGPLPRADLLSIFIKLVGMGCFKPADSLADRVDAAVFRPDEGEWGHAAIEAGYALAMLFLHHRGNFTRAADRFGRLYLEILERSKDSRAVTGLERLWPARFHEGYSLHHAGDIERSREIFIGLRDLPPDATPALSPELREHAKALLR